MTTTLHTSFTAAAGFEAARCLTGLPALHRQARLHGHSFELRVRSELAPGWADVPGGEVAQLARRVADAVQALDHRPLHELLAEPDDAALAGWLAARLELPGLLQLGLRSAPRHGVLQPAGGALQHWRAYAFQAAHRLPRVPLGHKCGRMHGHGFETVLHVAGVAHHDEIDEAWAPLHHELHHACLNDLPGLENPTSEVIAHWLWQRLKPALPGLSTVTVHETGSSGALFDGTDCRIWKQMTLDSAVRLERAPQGHALRRLHGHTYTLRLHLQGPLDEVLGWVVDFGDVKRLFQPLFDRLDHRALHEIDGLAHADTATLAAWVLAQARDGLPALDRVDLFETPGCGAIVRTGAERAPLPL